MTKPSLVFMRSQAKEGHQQYRLRKAETMIRFWRGEARFFLPETKGHDALHARRGVSVLMRRETHGSAIRDCPQYPNIRPASRVEIGPTRRELCSVTERPIIKLGCVPSIPHSNSE